jgi:hypothetical protein
MANNAAQIERAARAIVYWRNKHPDGEVASLRDLLADIMHWCDCYGVDFDHELSMATDFFGDEIS